MSDEQQPIKLTAVRAEALAKVAAGEVYSYWPLKGPSRFADQSYDKLRQSTYLWLRQNRLIRAGSGGGPRRTPYVITELGRSTLEANGRI